MFTFGLVVGLLVGSCAGIWLHWWLTGVPGNTHAGRMDDE